jgi:hypothetical protein
MKFFAAMCGTAALVTAAVMYHVLGNFAATYDRAETTLPALTQALLWKGGVVPPALLFASAIIVFAGLLRKNNQVMLTGGIATIVLMFGAATLVPIGVMLPLEKIMLEVNGGTQPKPAPAPAKDDSIQH